MRRAIAVLAACASMLPVPTAGAHGRGEPLSGSDYVPLPCSPTGPDYLDPATGRFNCTGTSTWSGTLTGETVYRSEGTVDLVTGDQRGTTEVQLFARTADGHHGSLHLFGTLAADGATGETILDLRIADGTGDFARSSGLVHLTGTTAGPGVGLLSYAGRWTHPAYAVSP